MCDALGVGCDTATAQIDQNNPPEVFSFTIKGTFTNWTDIPKETFVCDTRKREDRACIWEGYIAEVKRNATLVFEPFPHDRGMYDVRVLMAHSLGKDTNYSGLVQTIQKYQGKMYVMAFDEISITAMSQSPLFVEFRNSNYKGDVDYNEPPLGKLTVTFKEVLK